MFADGFQGVPRVFLESALSSLQKSRIVRVFSSRINLLAFGLVEQ